MAPFVFKLHGGNSINVGSIAQRNCSQCFAVHRRISNANPSFRMLQGFLCPNSGAAMKPGSVPALTYHIDVYTLPALTYYDKYILPALTYYMTCTPSLPLISCWRRGRWRPPLGLCSRLTVYKPATCVADPSCT
eukprot:199316-Chlamydomonas_euryale.AAC.3